MKTAQNASGHYCILHLVHLIFKGSIKLHSKKCILFIRLEKACTLFHWESFGIKIVNESLNSLSVFKPKICSFHWGPWLRWAWLCKVRPLRIADWKGRERSVTDQRVSFWAAKVMSHSSVSTKTPPNTVEFTKFSWRQFFLALIVGHATSNGLLLPRVKSSVRVFRAGRRAGARDQLYAGWGWCGGED